jgi:hypothetical protein
MKDEGDKKKKKKKNGGQLEGPMNPHSNKSRG